MLFDSVNAATQEGGYIGLGVVFLGFFRLIKVCLFIKSGSTPVHESPRGLFVSTQDLHHTQGHYLLTLTRKYL